MLKEFGFKEGGGGQKAISYFSIRLSHTHVEINEMRLKSISVVMSFPMIIFEIEHYECKSRMMHADVWEKTSNFFYSFGRGGGGGT